MNLIWYNSLQKPLFTPPSGIFAPVWGVLYVLMFVSFWIMIYSDKNQDKKLAVILFSVQLLLNFSWTPVFFYFHNIKLAFIIILLLAILLVLTIVKFLEVSKLSGILLIPYFLWVIFAMYLNFEFMILN